MLIDLEKGVIHIGKDDNLRIDSSSGEVNQRMFI
jgi:hypothetical protein